VRERRQPVTLAELGNVVVRKDHVPDVLRCG
jgi:hypothetical protein